MKPLIAGAIALALIAALAGCSADPLAEQYANGTTQNYISGNGTVKTIPVAERGDSVDFEGVTSAGAAVSSDDYRGEVLVINFWYAGCPPCRVEMPDLQALNEQFDGKGAAFLGVNVRDQAATSKKREDEVGLTYPSIIDTNDGNMLFAFAGTVAPNAVPTTLVIDQKGRVAARILGALDGTSTLRTIIDDTIAEGNG